MLKKTLSKAKGEFAKNVIILMSGTGMAQLVPIVFIPILTRLYSPEDFGVLALFVATSSILAVVATARYELAVMLPEKKEDAVALVFLCVFVSALLSLLVFLGVFIWGKEFSIIVGSEKLYPWLYLIPVSVFITGTFQSISYWYNREKEYKKIAIGKAGQSSGAGFQALFGVGGAFGGGLIVGRLMGQFAALMYISHSFFTKDKRVKKGVNAESLGRNAKRYMRYPLLSTPGAALDTAAQQAPVFYASKIFDSYVTGIFSLTHRVLNVPLSLMSFALSQVLYQKVVETQKNAPELLHGLVVKIFFILLAVMTPYVAILYFYGEPLFSFFLGQEWEAAGALAAILGPAVAIQFAVTPLSVVLAMDHNVKLGTTWQVIYFFSLCTILFYAKDLPYEQFFTVFCVHEMVLYLLYFALILRGAKHRPTMVE